MGEQLYGYTAAEHEYRVSVPELSAGDPELIIYVSAHGGGTVGETYADNGWDYLVALSGQTVAKGSDLRSGGMPQGHADMARVLADCLTSWPERIRALAAEKDRLSIFASETDGE